MPLVFICMGTLCIERVFQVETTSTAGIYKIDNKIILYREIKHILCMSYGHAAFVVTMLDGTKHLGQVVCGSTIFRTPRIVVCKCYYV